MNNLSLHSKSVVPECISKDEYDKVFRIAYHNWTR